MAGRKKQDRELRRSVIAARYELEGSVPIAKDLGVSRGAVLGMARRMGLCYKDRYLHHGDKIRAASASPNSGYKVRALKSTSCNIHYFDSWSSNMAYILGFLYADGSIARNQLSLSIAISQKDRRILSFIKKEMKIKSPIKDYSARGKTGPYSCIRTGSTVLVSKLNALGMRHRKTFRDDPFPEIPKEFLGDFVRGFFDGDGSVSVRRPSGGCSVRFVGTSKFISGLINGLRDQFGIEQKQAPQTKGKEAVWSRVSWSKPNDLRIFYRAIYSPGRFCLSRKRNQLYRWLMKPRVEMKVSLNNASELNFPKPLSLGDKLNERFARS